MDFHEVADLFPSMEESEYKDLVSDIKANGLLEPVWTYEGKIIDGRHRYKACTELGIEPRYREWEGQGSLVSFVLSLNMNRRSLTPSQKAVVALRAEELFAEEAAERQRAAGGNHGNQYTVSKMAVTEIIPEAANSGIEVPSLQVEQESVNESKEVSDQSVIDEPLTQDQEDAEISEINEPPVPEIEDVEVSEQVQKQEPQIEVKKESMNQELVLKEQLNKKIDTVSKNFKKEVDKKINEIKVEKKIKSEAREQAAAVVGVNAHYVTDVKKIQSVAPELLPMIKNGEMTVSAAIRKIKRDETRELAKVTEAPTGKYRTIVMDPPWRASDIGDCDMSGRSAPDYNTMSLEEIQKIPMADITEDNCHLYLWVTNRFLPKAFSLLDAWGFRYITLLTWCKPSIGLGAYYRNSTEHIIFAVKGSMPIARADIGTWFSADKSRHSAKPDKFYEIVESCSPGPRLDMFARTPRDGWKVWGAEI